MDEVDVRDRVSWKVKLSGRRVFGVVRVKLDGGSCVVEHDRTGFLFTVAARDLTKECG
jgi:hypothetical protein